MQRLRAFYTTPFNPARKEGQAEKNNLQGLLVFDRACCSLSDTDFFCCGYEDNIAEEDSIMSFCLVHHKVRRNCGRFRRPISLSDFIHSKLGNRDVSVVRAGQVWT